MTTGLRGLCLHETFERQARRTPDATAIVCGNRRFTYDQLDRRSNQLARLLRERGLGPGRFAAIYFDRSELPIVAILACHKSGTTYVPLDPAYPGDRISYIADELGISVCLTDSGLATNAANHLPDAGVVVLDALEAELAHCSELPLSREESGVRPDDLAYIIYTSGSTGRPKGVMVEHQAVTTYVDAFNQVCATGLDDRVYQGFSLSFDGSVEELWMAFSNGSTLVVPTSDAPRFGDDLGRYLTEHRVTYFSTVPTMLSTLGEDIPSLRTIVLSGEVCPPELVNRWARPGLRLLNVYGPTEATVNTSVAECVPNAQVTIGRPLPGYGIHVVDEHLRPVPAGAKGELLISGPTLARGYVGLPELTAQRFLVTTQIAGADRFYRTGDLVRWTAEGNLEFHGRIDTQVKIRGYRVELAEIESVLVEHPQVRTAVVRLIERDGLQQLAAYVVAADPPAQLDRVAILNLLETRMPPYMVPTYLDSLPELPRTTSGKIDRARLPRPAELLVRTSRTIVAPRGALETHIARVWSEVLGVADVSVEDDFFLDLGGHSLIAALMVTRLRERIPQTATVRDVYQCPTVRALAGRLRGRPVAEPGGPRTEVSGRTASGEVSRWRRSLTVTLQAISIYALSAVGMVLSAPVLLGVGWIVGRVSTLTWVVASVAILLFGWPTLLSLSIAAKWLIIGRYRAGDYPLWGFYYWRCWICDRFQAFSGSGVLIGTPLLPLYFRLMGARVGQRCTLDTAQVAAWDLVSIGDDTSIGAGTQLAGSRIEDGMLRLGTVEIGSGCFVGIHSALGLHVRMDDGSALDDQSLLADGQHLAPGVGYRGSPAEPGQVWLPAGGAPARRGRRFLFGVLHLLFAELLGLVMLVPGIGFIIAWRFVYLIGGFGGMALAMACSIPIGVVLSCVLIAGFRRAVLNTMRPGTYPVESLIYLRKWLSDGLMGVSRTLLRPVYTTLYLPPWLRLMGAKIGPRAELSTVQSFAPELIAVGPESFFADGSIIGGRRAHRGVFEVAVNRIGRRSFVGNSAVLPVGISLGDGCLLGVQSVPPQGSPRVADRSEWLGSPSFRLTHRPTVGNFGDTLTYQPTRTLYLQRALIDGLRILIPGYLALGSFLVWCCVVYWTAQNAPLAVTLAAAPAYAIVIALCTVAVVALLKKAVMGTYKPEVKPLWSMYVWLNEMINGAYESVVAPVLLPFLGTPFVAPMLRMFGARIGKQTYIATTLMSEWDLIEIGDRAALNSGVVIQNHLFEDRVFKSSHLSVGPETSVGNMSVILYDSRMERGAVVGPLSLLMKGETLREGTRWSGIPTAPAHRLPPARVAAPTRQAPSPVDPRPDRIPGVDLARGLALLGVLAVQALTTFAPGGVPTSATFLVGGVSAATFAVLAGTSAALLSGGRRIVRGRARVAASAGIAVRALLIGLIGLGLGYTGLSGVILTFYAALFLVALLFIGFRAQPLAALTGVLIGLGPIALLPTVAATTRFAPVGGTPTLATLVENPLGLLSTLFLSGTYPVLAYLVYLLAGLAIGRLDLNSVRVARWSLGGGLTLAVGAWVSSALLAAAVPATGPVRVITAAPGPAVTSSWWLGLNAPRSNPTLDLLQTLGSAMAVIGLALLLSRSPLLARLLRPVSAAGGMTLTLYAACLLVIATGVGADRPDPRYLGIAVGAIAIATLWQLVLGRGPLERLVAVAGRRTVWALARPVGPTGQLEANAGDRDQPTSLLALASAIAPAREVEVAHFARFVVLLDRRLEELTATAVQSGRRSVVAALAATVGVLMVAGIATGIMKPAVSLSGLVARGEPSSPVPGTAVPNKAVPNKAVPNKAVPRTPAAAGAQAANPTPGLAAANGGSVDAAGVAFVRDFYGLLPGDAEAAFERLTPKLQRDAGGLSGYLGFYRDIASVMIVGEPVAVAPDRIVTTIRFQRRGGAVSVERYEFTLLTIPNGPRLLRAATRL